MTRAQKLKYARAVLMTQDRIALRYQRIVRKELKQTAQELSQSYLTNESRAQFVDVQTQHAERMHVILENLSLDASNAFKVFTLKATKKAPLFDNFIEQRIFDILSKNANVISQTIAANTIAIASAAIAQTMTTATRDAVKSEPINVARAIVRATGGAASVSRAMTIARTETHKAANTSQYTRAEWAAQDEGLDVVVEWISTNDSRVRDAHKNADGQKRDIGQPFNVNGEMMMHPSDPKASAANVINCRCVLGYDTQ